MPLNCLPSSLCSPQGFIVIIILLYVYLTLQNSVFLHQKVLVHQKDSRPNDDSVQRRPIMMASTGNFYDDFNVSWGDHRGKILEDGKALTLELDRFSGSGFESKKEYLYAKISIEMKLVPNNSAGTVTTYYMSSQGSHHDEIDFEFLGNVSGEPYTVHTNIFCQGVGNREQQFYLWFDPTADFHTYSIIWTPLRIVFLVDAIPIREFKNMESIGVPFPKEQPMRIYSSLWNADDWATQGGRVKTDWSKAPFVASYRSFKADACVWIRGSSTCEQAVDKDKEWLTEGLERKTRAKIREVQNKYMTYDYCKDELRFPQGLPKECTY